MALRIISAPACVFEKKYHNEQFNGLWLHTTFLSKFWIRGWFLHWTAFTRPVIKAGLFEELPLRAVICAALEDASTKSVKFLKSSRSLSKLKAFHWIRLTIPWQPLFIFCLFLPWRLKSPIFTLPPEANKMANLTFLVSVKNEIRNGHYVLLGVYNLSL